MPLRKNESESAEINLPYVYTLQFTYSTYTNVFAHPDKALILFAAVVPVAAATMTPLPLLFGLAVMKLRSIFGKGETLVPIREEESPCPEDPNENGDGFKASESSAKLMPKQEVMMVPQH